MFITLSPIRAEGTLSLSRFADVLWIDGVAFDFSSLAEGEVLSRDTIGCDRLLADVQRRDGRLHLTILFPHGANPPEEARFPAPIIVDADGPIPLPPADLPGGADADTGEAP